jgi:hypothetical protein
MARRILLLVEMLSMGLFLVENYRRCRKQNATMRLMPVARGRLF